jgi:hypothetical protein
MRPRDLGRELARALELERAPKGVPVTIKSINELNRRVAADQTLRDELRAKEGEALARNLREEPSCTKHGWGTGTNVKPKPPASLCPECAKERRAVERARDHTHETIEVSIWGGRSTKVGVTPLAVELWEKKQAELYGEDGVGPTGNIRPGSKAEGAALEITADVRAEHRGELRDSPSRRRARARRYWGKKLKVPASAGNWRSQVNAVHAGRR